MAKKTTTSFNIDNTAGKLTKPSVFDRIVKEIDASEIPALYIDYILVQYTDGNVVELSGAELSHPIPVNRNADWGSMEEAFKKMKDVRVFIDVAKLEVDINEEVEKYLGHYC